MAGLSDSQLPGIFSLACPWVINLLFASTSLIGNTPSNIKPDGTEPVTLSGLLTKLLATGEFTIGILICAWGVGVATTVEFGFC